MPPPLSKSQTYRHFRVDADQDISADPVSFGLDKLSWPATGTFVPTNSLPARVAAVDAANPPQSGLTGYWFRIEVGPGQAIQPYVGINTFFAQINASPQLPILRWQLNILD